MVPGTFRAAVPAVLGLVAREGEGLLEAKQSALASLVALLACVPGAAEDAVAHGAVHAVIAACEAAPGGALDRNALEAFRILVTADAAATATVEDDAKIGPLIAFVKTRAVGGERAEAQGLEGGELAEAALDLLCGLAAKRRDGGACRDAVVRRGGGPLGTSCVLGLRRPRVRAWSAASTKSTTSAWGR